MNKPARNYSMQVNTLTGDTLMKVLSRVVGIETSDGLWVPQLEWGDIGPLKERYDVFVNPCEWPSKESFCAQIKRDGRVLKRYTGTTQLEAISRAIIAFGVGDMVESSWLE